MCWRSCHELDSAAVAALERACRDHLAVPEELDAEAIDDGHEALGVRVSVLDSPAGHGSLSNARIGLPEELSSLAESFERCRDFEVLAEKPPCSKLLLRRVGDLLGSAVFADEAPSPT